MLQLIAAFRAGFGGAQFEMDIGDVGMDSRIVATEIPVVLADAWPTFILVAAAPAIEVISPKCSLADPTSFFSFFHFLFSLLGVSVFVKVRANKKAPLNIDTRSILKGAFQMKDGTTLLDCRFFEETILII